jgi:RNA polymerase sigma-70 factor (ECF subfamily)
MGDTNVMKRGRMPTTHWSQIGRAASGDGGSLDALLSLYQGPLKAHLVSRFGAGKDDVEDWFQGFVHEKILVRDLLMGADRARGRFRTFLINSLERYVIQQHRRSGARKRYPEGGFVTLEQWELQDPEQASLMVEAFDAAWGRVLLDEVIRRTREECIRKGRPEIWGLLLDRLVDPILHGGAVISYSELVERYGFESPVRAANLLTTGKRMFQRNLEAVVREYADADEVGGELSHIERILSLY